MPTSGLVGLNPTTTILPNGVRLLAKQTGTTPAVTISLTVRAGSVHDPLELPGVAFLLSRVIDRGTFEAPNRYPDGIAHVFVNGGHAVRNGRATGTRAGRGLRRQV